MLNELCAKIKKIMPFRFLSLNFKTLFLPFIYYDIINRQDTMQKNIPQI